MNKEAEEGEREGEGERIKTSKGYLEGGYDLRGYLSLFGNELVKREEKKKEEEKEQNISRQFGRGDVIL